MTSQQIQTKPSQNGQVHRRVRERQPYLIETKLDEERAKRFVTPVTWEMLKDVSGESEDIVHQGMVDYNDPDDRASLGELATYCFKNGFFLLTYVAEESE